MIVDKNYYTNLRNLYIFFLGKFKTLSNVAQDFDANLYPVNNFFTHWVKKIDILKYGTTNNYTAGNLHVFGRHAKTFAKKCVKND